MVLLQYLIQAQAVELQYSSIVHTLVNILQNVKDVNSCRVFYGPNTKNALCHTLLTHEQCDIYTYLGIGFYLTEFISCLIMCNGVNLLVYHHFLYELNCMMTIQETGRLGDISQPSCIHCTLVSIPLQ